MNRDDLNYLKYAIEELIRLADINLCFSSDCASVQCKSLRIIKNAIDEQDESDLGDILNPNQ